MPPKRTNQKKQKKMSSTLPATPKVFTASAMRRVARRGGVKRLARLAYEEVRKDVLSFVKKLVTDSIVYAEHRRCCTVSAMDVVHAARVPSIPTIAKATMLRPPCVTTLMPSSWHPSWHHPSARAW